MGRFAGVFCSFLLLSRVASGQPPGLEWADLPPLPVAVSGQFAGVHGEALIVAGGASFEVSPWQGGEKEWHNGIWVLLPEATEWVDAGTLPHALAYGASASTANGVIIAGGSDGARHYRETWRLQWDGERVSLNPLAPLPGPTAYCGGALLDGSLYVAGGQEAPQTTTALSSLWKLDTAAPDAWEVLEPIPGPGRILPVVAAQAGSLYVISGASLAPDNDGAAARTYLRDGHRYAPGAGWSPTATAPHPVVAAPAHAYGQSHVLVFGGDDGTHYAETAALGDDHPGFANDILAYHTITDSWAQYGTIANPVVTTTAVEWQGRIVIPGGEDRPGHRIALARSALAKPTVGGFGTLNWAVLISYFIVLIAIGAYFSRREKSTDDYFLGGRRVPWWAMGLSIFGTQLSAITFLSIPARAYTSDWVYVWANAAIILIAPYVVYVVIPAYRRGNYTTAYEYLEHRFNYALRVYGAFIFLLFQAGRMGIVLFLPAIALRAVTGLPVEWCILAMGVLATLYTVMGGIEAVIWTDVVQVFVLAAGVIVALVVILVKLDGNIVDAFAIASEANKFHMVDWSWDPTTTAIWVAIIGNVFGVAYPYTADQTLVQRYLASSSEREAKRATWTNALMSIPATLLFFGVGTALFVYFKTHPETLDPALRNDAVFPLFIVQQLPVGVSGLVIAAIFAAAMSSLDSSMNSLATVAVHDFYRRFKKNVSDHTALRAARILTIAFGVLGTGAALVMAGLDAPSLFDQYLRILNFTGGGLAGVLALGILTRRANSAGAITGALVSAVVVIAVATYTPIHHFLYALVGFVTAFVVGYLASLVLPGRSDLAGPTR